MVINTLTVMEKDILEILLTEEQIKTRIREMAEELNREYAGKNPLVVGVLKGVVPFFGKTTCVPHKQQKKGSTNC